MKNKIKNYIKAGYPALFVCSHEETRAESEIGAVVKELGFNMYQWTLTTGITNPLKASVIPDSEDPASMLDKFVGLPNRSVLVAKDFHLFMGDQNPLLIRKMKEALNAGKRASQTLIVIGCQVKLVPELEKEITVVDFGLPDRSELDKVLIGIAKGSGITLNDNRDQILDAALGMTTIETENAFALSVVESGDINPQIVSKEKSNTVKKNGVLEIVDVKERITDIGGLETLKSWLSKRKLSFGKKAKDYGLPTPKGILAIGIPGCGKTITAKACASIFGVPLLKLDGGKLFGSLVGESERNMRTAIQTAEAVAPCVLLVDEIEKAFSGTKSSGNTDGGTSSRVFGTFLQWLNDKTSPVFVFATANDISQLPPEFLRKGRFDELFYVDLPSENERKEIWKIQITKHGRKPEIFDLEKLTTNSVEFTGAEIEAAFTDAMFSAFDDNQEVSTPYVTEAIANTVPLAKTMGEQIQTLRNWAKGRARYASSQNQSAQPTVTRKIINN